MPPAPPVTIATSVTRSSSGRSLRPARRAIAGSSAASTSARVASMWAAIAAAAASPSPASMAAAMASCRSSAPSRSRENTPPTGRNMRARASATARSMSAVARGAGDGDVEVGVGAVEAPDGARARRAGRAVQALQRVADRLQVGVVVALGGEPGRRALVGAAVVEDLAEGRQPGGAPGRVVRAHAGGDGRAVAAVAAEHDDAVGDQALERAAGGLRRHAELGGDVVGRRQAVARRVAAERDGAAHLVGHEADRRLGAGDGVHLAILGVGAREGHELRRRRRGSAPAARSSRKRPSLVEEPVGDVDRQARAASASRAARAPSRAASAGC